MIARVSVRQATLDDVDRLVDLHTRTRCAYYGAGGLDTSELVTPEAQQELRQAWTGSIGSPENRVRCAESDGALVGLVAMGPPLDAEENAATVGQLYQIHVDPASWGKGVGSLLYSTFIAYLRETRRSVGLLEV